MGFFDLGLGCAFPGRLSPSPLHAQCWWNLCTEAQIAKFLPYPFISLLLLPCGSCRHEACPPRPWVAYKALCELDKAAFSVALQVLVLAQGSVDFGLYLLPQPGTLVQWTTCPTVFSGPSLRAFQGNLIPGFFYLPKTLAFRPGFWSKKNASSPGNCQ